FCGLATLMWGWVKVKDYGIKKLMLWYTAAFVAFILGYVVMLSAGAGAIMSLGEEIELEMQGAMEEAMEEAMREAEAEAVEGGASQ
ncbi:MAG: hypothetical protein P8J87_05075, partial [Verrucomicrobiales bacterium]|nr:hypothetical protein [Verrucomicrobiales bacterium]